MNQILEIAKGVYRFIDFARIMEGSLDPGYYNLTITESGPLLSKINTPVLPPRVYQQDNEFIERVIKSFNHFERNTGCLLSGRGGTGKTVTSKIICNRLNLPVILMNNPVPKNFDLSDFINSINFECILFFDEFEKNFDSYHNDEASFLSQEALLGVLDGINSSVKKLFLFTCNEQVNRFLLNRPSRIKFHKKYDAISEDLVRAIINDRLVNKDFIMDIINNIDNRSCTIDILCSIIDEVNLHNVPFSSFKEEFNYSEAVDTYTLYEITDNGSEKIESLQLSEYEVNQNPYSSVIGERLTRRKSMKHKYYYENEGRKFFLMEEFTRYAF